MSACCYVASDRKSPRLLQKVREIFAWVVPSALLVLLPKCPACLAAYVALWTGLGLSLSMAIYMRWAMILLCIASLLFLIMRRLGRVTAVFSHDRNR
jgi:hypothetical protein